MQNESAVPRKLIYRGLSLALVLTLWKIATLFYPPIIVPGIKEVALYVIHIFTDAECLHMLWVTALRLIAGLAIGVAVGAAAGIAMGNSEVVYGLLMPVISIFQTVPPVSWVVLAIVWFGFNGRPAIFIVVIATIPVIAINITEGIRRVDKGLLEMAKIYRFSSGKTMKNIILPSVFPYFRSGLNVALGSGWKIAVMGEVLTTNDGIGGMIKTARLNIEPGQILAWSVCIVVLYFISEVLINGRLLSRKH